MEIDYSWAKQLVSIRAMVLHVPTQVIGATVQFYEPGEYISPINDKPVDEAIIRMHEGNAFVARAPTDFLPLTEAEIAYLQIVRAQLSGTVRLLCDRNTLCGAVPKAASVILISEMTDLVQKLTTAHGNRFGSKERPSE